MYNLSAVRILTTQYLQSHPVPTLPHHQPQPHHQPRPQPHALSRYCDIGPWVVTLVDNRGKRLVSAVFNKNQNAQITDLILIYQVRLAQWSMRHRPTPTLVIGKLVSTDKSTSLWCAVTSLPPAGKNPCLTKRIAASDLLCTNLANKAGVYWEVSYWLLVIGSEQVYTWSSPGWRQAVHQVSL